jgi:acyl-homoserine-lactone acylase
VEGARNIRAAVAVALAGATLVACLPALAQAAGSDPYRVTIRRTAHGIPHIIAGDWASLAYGYGYSLAQDNICVLADMYVTVRAERSRYFGPDGSWTNRGNSTTANNLNSDFFYQKIIDQRTVERLLAEPPPAGPLPEIREGVRGYVAGYNAYLRDVGVDHISDPACRGKPWVKPLEEIDAYRRFYSLALLASSGVAVDGIGGASPLVSIAAGQRETAAQRAKVAAATRAQRNALSGMTPNRFDDLLGGIGSNAFGLGREATQSGHGMVLGNPHFPWDGSERFYQAQLTIPGKVDVAGASLMGVPLINIGFTRGLAWSHTVSTARRFTPFQLNLVPGQPTSYMVDGAVHTMKPTDVTVMALVDGALRPEKRTLYDTEWGPVLTGILNLPIFPWTPVSAFALGDVNAGNFRYLNHFFLTNEAQSVPELDAIEKRYLGIPWVNTIAADSTGKAYYADIGAVPNVSNAKIADCSTPLGVVTDRALRVQILDGSRSSCRWDSDPDAIKPGIFGPSHLPWMIRDDYVTNSNDSYWLSNPKHPLEGFSRVIGDERTVRTPRTRLGLRIVQQRLDGTDGMPGKGFTVDLLTQAVLNDRQYLGEQWRDAAVAMCKQSPLELGTSGLVDVSGACPVLEKWDLHDNLDSKGALLFRRFAAHVVAAPGGAPANPFASYVWAKPFDASDAVNTPSGLNTSNPYVRAALADAVTDLQNLGAPLDASLRDWQYEKRGDEKIPIHGGPGTLGDFNAINVTWNAATGYGNVPHGSSHIQAVELTGGCPIAKTILTYSQSTDPTSPWFADQTRMFSKKEWVTWPFCEDAINADPDLQVLDFNGGYAGATVLRKVKVTSRRRGLVVRFTLTRPATVTVTVKHKGKSVRVVKRAGVRGKLKLTIRGLKRGRYRLTVRARAGGRTDISRRTGRAR